LQVEACSEQGRSLAQSQGRGGCSRDRGDKKLAKGRRIANVTPHHCNRAARQNMAGQGRRDWIHVSISCLTGKLPAAAAAAAAPQSTFLIRAKSACQVLLSQTKVGSLSPSSYFQAAAAMMTRPDYSLPRLIYLGGATRYTY
jgi:hypothetical protein